MPINTTTRRKESAARPTSCLHFCARNDVNGNPQRVYVAYNSRSQVVAITDEGYDGKPKWLSEMNARQVWEVRVDVSVTEYRKWIKRAQEFSGNLVAI